MLGRSRNAVQLRARHIGLERLCRLWTKPEIALVKKHYDRMPLDELAALLGRSAKAVTLRASALGLTVVPRLWSAEEIEQVRLLYRKVPAATIAKRLGRPAKSVMVQAQKLGLSRSVKPVTTAMVRTIMKKIGRVNIEKIAAEIGIGAARVTNIARANGYDGESWFHRNWERREDTYLRQHYRRMPIGEIAQKLERTPKAVLHRLDALGLPRSERHQPQRVRWTKKQDDLLRRNYRTLPVAELAAMLSRTPHAVRNRLKLLRLLRLDVPRTSARAWTAKEDATMRRLYGERGCRKRLAERLGRSVPSINGRASKLGLMKPAAKRDA
ncbi:MAG TPA: hypothetical protein VHI13_13190 [Candidatus Kapabacteria bacterium]|nr:hypothetical protein [Candidatus Kapabacteria bacterium]